MESLKLLAKQLYIAREEHTKLKGEYQKKMDEFNAATLDLATKVRDMAMLVKDAEGELRDAAIVIHKENGETTLPFGVKIQNKTFKEVTDPEKALEWAIDKKLFLQLDSKSLLSYLEGNPTKEAMTFAKIEKRFAATLPTDNRKLVSQ